LVFFHSVLSRVLFLPTTTVLSRRFFGEFFLGEKIVRGYGPFCEAPDLDGDRL